MQVVTGAEMQKLEEQAFKALGLSPLLVMENAGSRIVEVLKAKFSPLSSKRVHILVGSGNNGGDGLVVARQLIALGARVKVYLVGSRQKASTENLINLEILEKLGADIVKADVTQLGKLRFSLSLADLIIDAVFGTGFAGNLVDELVSLIEVVNETQCAKVAIDCPTGVNSTTGEVGGTAFQAHLTINLGLLKMGCVLYPGQLYAGENCVVDLGFPLSAPDNATRLLGSNALGWLCPREPWTHKGTFGHVMVVAGSLNYAGAAYLSGQAVLRGGAGRVTLAIPKGIYHRFSPDEMIVTPVPETEGGAFGQASLTRLFSLLEDKDVLAIGPGVGREQETVQVIQEILQLWEKPVVIDADGLMALDGEFLQQIPQAKRQKWIITPHPGEMGRLIGETAGNVNANRLGVALDFASRWDLVVVLKGAPTIIADNSTTYINSTGNPGLATAGTGDVLTGLIAALLAQGLEPIRAAALGAYVHGRAGDMAATKGERGLRASDCLDYLQEILQ